MPELLALAGLVIATVLYSLLVRRRSLLRFGVDSMSRALSASNEVALERMRRGFRSESPAPEAAGIVTDRRSGKDRRGPEDRRRGRGRRTGADRRRGASSA
jgi:hypothetical protein